MSTQTFAYYTLLRGPNGPTYASVAASVTVTDTADSANDGQTAVGDQFYVDAFGGANFTFVGTTVYGIVAQLAGNHVLLSDTSYSAFVSPNYTSTSDPYPYCFLGGTRIAAPEGEVPVEYLKIGDLVVTDDGRRVPVKWLGKQRVKNWMFTGAHKAPVFITKGALGDGLPHTDLYVSADHGMLLDGLVINAAALVNHTTIRFVPMAEMPPEFAYYHVETEAHDVILANGTPAETFIDYAARKDFDNYAEYEALYGAERIIPEMPRPRISTRRLVPDAIKARVDTIPDWDAVLDDPQMTVRVFQGAA